MIKFIFRWAFRLLILAIVLVVALLLLKDTLLKALLEYQIRSATGMEVKIQRLEVQLSAPVITMEGFRLYNTAEFGGAPLVDMPELHFEYDRDAMTHQQLRFKLLRLNLSELSLVRNQAGKTNLMELATRLQSGKVSGPVVGVPLEFEGIDTLNLTLGKLRYVDLKEPAKSRDLSINLTNEVVTNLKTEADFTTLALKIFLRNGLSLLFPQPKLNPVPQKISPPTLPASR